MKNQNTQNKTVVVGMSGGVDSSVSALLLKQQGYNVVGLFMKNWEEKDESGICTSEADFADVKRVCEKLEIPYYAVNFSEQYLDKVFAEFLEDFKKGYTPNPDVLCNREIKFGPFLQYALKMGADYVATGHYCNIKEINGQFYLAKAVDTNKDQTYFLNQLSQEQLRCVMFPIGGLTKPQVREIAESNGLITAKKKDSTGICFIGERKFKDFLKTYLPAKAGDIYSLAGEKLGHHDGLMYYTLGQRRGLNIGGKADGINDRWFVVKKDLEKNILYVNHGEHNQMFSTGLKYDTLNLIPPTIKLHEIKNLKAKFRYRQEAQDVAVSGSTVTFKNKQRSVTPGQWVVFYDNEFCLGGAKIIEVIYGK
ncbi:MAG: tRNA 2-thiouridine(34) synthase MnmA [Firmicutes bacterium]|nr:tRNA 2-thiouridine(34) synthase MnmA [Bacillota bacterium]